MEEVGKGGIYGQFKGGTKGGGSAFSGERVGEGTPVLVKEKNILTFFGNFKILGAGLKCSKIAQHSLLGSFKGF
jgi:hypothetical protein